VLRCDGSHHHRHRLFPPFHGHLFTLTGCEIHSHSIPYYLSTREVESVAQQRARVLLEQRT